MNKKLIIPIVAVVAALGGYKMVLAKPKEAPPKPKVAGEVYVLPKEFLVNLDDGRFARVSVALELDHSYSSHVAAAEYAKAHGGGGHGAAAAPEGYGTLPQEPVLRDIIGDMLAESSAKELQRPSKREHVKEDIAKAINKKTDVKVHHVLFTDVAVQ